tara:strand:+ start:274 stop:1773 length:1500 start_codon:yes stop_codon:yes gene_type:complete
MDELESKRAKGQNYHKFLGDMHKVIKPKWYLEIGTQTGKSLLAASCNCIAVDPTFALKHDVIDRKKRLFLFQETSDDFFRSDFMSTLGHPIDLAFLDGMHLYEYLLRDFTNAEKFMSPDGVIVMHDCLPYDSLMAERDRGKSPTRAWCGDVWKIVPILQEYRPDLKAEIFDADPTGLVVVSNLDPKNDSLQYKYDEIILKYNAEENVVKYVKEFAVTPTSLRPWQTSVATAKLGLDFVIQISARNSQKMKRWGDYHFALGLAGALERLGHTARIQSRKDWNASKSEGEIDIVLRGRVKYQPRAGNLTIYWVISGGSEVQAGELNSSDHIFVAREPLTESWINSLGDQKVSLLLQAFDKRRMELPSVDVERQGVVFVGITRGGVRPIVKIAIEAGVKPKLWGDGWRDTECSEYVVEDRVANEDLFRIYNSAEVVLNDQTNSMARSGLISNRIFDALAFGTPVITMRTGNLPNGFSVFVQEVSSVEEFSEAYNKIKNETDE